MTLGRHLENHWGDWPITLPMVGRIKAVLAKDHPDNPTGTYTLYNVEVYEEFMAGPRDYEHVPALGQMASGGVEIELTYEIDQYVLVGFRAGNETLPYIVNTFPWHDTEAAHTVASGPHVKLRARGATITITNDGDISLEPASGRTLFLGGDTADATMKKLMTEEMISVFNGHTHTSPAGGSTGTPSTPLSAGSHATDTTKGT